MGMHINSGIAQLTLSDLGYVCESNTGQGCWQPDLDTKTINLADYTQRFVSREGRRQCAEFDLLSME